MPALGHGLASLPRAVLLVVLSILMLVLLLLLLLQLLLLLLLLLACIKSCSVAMHAPPGGLGTGNSHTC